MWQSSYQTVRLVLLKTVLKVAETIVRIKTKKMQRLVRTMERLPKHNTLLVTQF